MAQVAICIAGDPRQPRNQTENLRPSTMPAGIGLCFSGPMFPLGMKERGMPRMLPDPVVELSMRVEDKAGWVSER